MVMPLAVPLPTARLPSTYFWSLFHKLQEDGWGTANIDDSEDAMTMPNILFCMCQEMLSAANPAFMPYIGLTTGAARTNPGFRL